MTKRYIIILFAVFISANVFAQPRSLGARDVILDDNAGNISYITTLLGGVGINQVNAMPDACAILDLNSTTKGFLAPRLGAAEIAALCGGAPPPALMVYNTSTGNYNIWNGTRYMAPWQTSGNLGTNSSIDFIGTADAADFVLRTNNVERMRLTGNPITNSSVAPLMTISNPTFNQQGVRLNGTNDALFGHTLAANPGVWDVVLNGDAVISGLVKLGGSMWIDGFTPNNHRILANDDLTIGTNAAGQNLTLTTGPGGVINVNSPLILGGFPMDVTVNNNTFAIRAIQNGTGNSSIFQIANPANTAPVTTVATNGIGSGITVQLTNAANGARGIDVLQAGVGPGVFATSAGGNAVWGITSSISAAGVIGDNTFGEAVVGRNRGGNGVGAVVGRNDSSGYGVRGFNTKDGIGVLGQSGISGGTGVGGRFENVNAANTSSTMQVATNGIGGGIEVDLSNAANGARGIDVTQAGVGPGVFATSAGGNAVWGITSSISAAGVIGDNTFGEAVVGRNRGGNGVGAVVGRNDSSGYGVRGFNTKDGIGVLGQSGISGGTGAAGRFENVNAANPTTALTGITNGGGSAGLFQVSNPASTSSTVNVTTNGIGSGITVQLTNASNGARGIDVLQAGVGPGVFATSAGGNAVWGITSSITAAGVIGDNTFGEAVVGRNRGGNGVGAVVGRNDSSGYGVRGFNTKDGIGVLGQAGISGGTGVGGRFENVNAANGNDALQAATNGTGWAGNFTNANNSSASRGVRISTTAGQGGNALTIANGTLSLSRQHPYASNTVIDDGILVVTAAGNVTVPTGPPLVDGATVWVVNNAGAVITVTNTTVGAFNINPGRAIQLLFVSTVSGANWIPVQP